MVALDMSVQEFLKPCRTFLVVGTVMSLIGGIRWYQGWRNKKQLKPVKWTETGVLIVGLDKAGKTSMARCVKFNPRPDRVLPEVESTMFWNESAVNVGCVSFRVWDIGGSLPCRQYWDKFLPNKDIIVWVVDSASQHRMKESKLALHRLLDHPESKGIPVVIVANKQDLCWAIDPLTVLDEMEVDKFKKHHKFFIVGSRMPNKGSRKFSNLQAVQY